MKFPRLSRQLEYGQWAMKRYVDEKGQPFLVMERYVGNNLVERRNPIQLRSVPRGLGVFDKPAFPFPTSDERDIPLPPKERGPYPSFKPKPKRRSFLTPPRLGLTLPRPAAPAQANTVRMGRHW